MRGLEGGPPAGPLLGGFRGGGGDVESRSRGKPPRCFFETGHNVSVKISAPRETLYFFPPFIRWRVTANRPVVKAIVWKMRAKIFSVFPKPNGALF